MDGFPLYRHQVSGHSCLLSREKYIYKPCTKLEADFYASMETEFPALAPFAPKFYGLATLPKIDKDKNSVKDASVDANSKIADCEKSNFSEEKSNDLKSLNDQSSLQPTSYTYWGRHILNREKKKSEIEISSPTFSKTLKKDSSLDFLKVETNAKSFLDTKPAPSPSANWSTPHTTPCLAPAVPASLPLDLSLESENVKCQNASPQQEYIILEDLTSKYRQPCILDLKLGVRQHGLNETKVLSKMNKVKNSTSSVLGLRLCGMQVYKPLIKQYIFRDKYYGRKIDSGEFERNIYEYFFNGNIFREDVIPELIEKLEHFKRVIGFQTKYRFYSSSLLLVYEGDISPQSETSKFNFELSFTGNSPADVRLIDFAHAAFTPPEEENMLDGGLLLGLQNLIHLFLRVYHKHSKSTSRNLPVKLLWDQDAISEAMLEIGSPVLEQYLSPVNAPLLPTTLIHAFNYSPRGHKDADNVSTTSSRAAPESSDSQSESLDILELTVLPNGSILNESFESAHWIL